MKQFFKVIKKIRFSRTSDSLPVNASKFSSVPETRAMSPSWKRYSGAKSPYSSAPRRTEIKLSPYFLLRSISRTVLPQKMAGYFQLGDLPTCADGHVVQQGGRNQKGGYPFGRFPIGEHHLCGPHQVKNLPMGLCFGLYDNRFNSNFYSSSS